MKALLAIVLLSLSSLSLADEYVSGYVRSDGTYVEPHYRSSPNQYKFDNYSSQGNSNPYTGRRGYDRNEFSSPPSYYTPPSNYNYQYNDPYSRRR